MRAWRGEGYTKPFKKKGPELDAASQAGCYTQLTRVLHSSYIPLLVVLVFSC